MFDRYFKESRAAAAVDDVEEHAGRTQRQRADYRIRAHGAGGQPNAAAYGATISILDNDPDIINVAREYGFKVYYGEATCADVLACQRRGTHRHRSGMRGQRRKCGQNCGKYSSYQPERQGVRARLGQTQCAGPK